MVQHGQVAAAVVLAPLATVDPVAGTLAAVLNAAVVADILVVAAVLLLLLLLLLPVPFPCILMSTFRAFMMSRARRGRRRRRRR